MQERERIARERAVMAECGCPRPPRIQKGCVDKEPVLVAAGHGQLNGKVARPQLGQECALHTEAA